MKGSKMHPINPPRVKMSSLSASTPVRQPYQSDRQHQQRFFDNRGAHQFRHPYSGTPHHHHSGQHFNHRGGSRSRGRGNHRGGRGGGGGGGNNGSNYQAAAKWKQNGRGRADKKENFYCCSCERGFVTVEQYEEHNSEHIVCGLDGCQFEAHALVVTKHISIQHSGGLFDRLKNLSTPEEINAWREERKKNYPSSVNIVQKEEELKEKVGRREVFGGKKSEKTALRIFAPETFRYKINADNNRKESRFEAQQRRRKIECEQGGDWRLRTFAADNKQRHVRVPLFSLNKSEVVCLESFYLDVKLGKDGKLQKEKKVKWKGFKAKRLDRLSDSESDVEEESMPISDEEDYYVRKEAESVGEQRAETETAIRKQKSSNCDHQATLGLSLVDYSSASESEDENKSDVPVQNLANNVCTVTSSCAEMSDSRVESSHSSATNAIKTVDKMNENTSSETSCGEEDDEDSDCSSKTSVESMIVEEFTGRAAKKPRSIAKRIYGGVRYRRKRFRTQLLERLLQDSIRKERNILLQTCQFLCENDFFMDHKDSTIEVKTADEEKPGSQDALQDTAEINIDFDNTTENGQVNLQEKANETM